MMVASSPSHRSRTTEGHIKSEHREPHHPPRDSAATFVAGPTRESAGSGIGLPRLRCCPIQQSPPPTASVCCRACLRADAPRQGSRPVALDRGGRLSVWPWSIPAGDADGEPRRRRQLPVLRREAR
jgi:hypothetical protein